MQGYEIVTIVDPQIADEDVPKTSDKINEFITSRGGAVARVQRWGRRRLAYPIKRQVEAHYLLTTFELDPEHSSELEADLVLAQEVLKHMVIKLDAEEFQRASEEPPPPPVVAEPPAANTESAEVSDAQAAEASTAEATPEDSASEEAVAEAAAPVAEDPAPEPAAEETAEPVAEESSEGDEESGDGGGAEAESEDKEGS